MWAYVKDNKIQEIIPIPKNIVIDDVKHPAKIFTNWSWSELNSIGIYTVEPATEGDSRFEITSSPTYTFSKTNKKVTSAVTKTNRELDDKTVNGDLVLGLKTLAKNTAKTQAHNLIKRFGWLVERNIYDNSKAIPDAVKTYVAAIQKDSDDICTDIDNAKDMTAFKALYADTVNSEGDVTQVNRINRWTSDSTVQDYIR